VKKLSGNRSLYFAVAVMAGVLLLFAVTAGRPSGQVSISFQTPFARSTLEFIQLEKIVARFQEQNPEIEVRLLPDGPAAPDLIIRRTLLRNAPDILEIPLESISEPVGRGTILPVADALSRGGGGNMFAWALRAAEHDRTIRAFPFRARSVQLIYNGSIFRRSGFDPENLLLKDWDDLLLACRDIKRLNSDRGCWALGVSGRDLKSTSQLGMMLVRQMDAEVIRTIEEEEDKEDKDDEKKKRGEVMIKSENGVEALGMVRKLGEYVPPEALDWSRDDLLREFNAGRVAIFFGDLRDVAHIRAEAPDVDVRVAEAPDKTLRASCVNFYGGVVNATTRYPESCKELLTYLCSLEAQEMIMKGGPGAPMFSPVRQECFGNEWYDENGSYLPFLQALEYPCMQERVDGWPEVEKQVFAPELRKLIAGETEATAAAESIKELGNQILSTHHGVIGHEEETSTLGKWCLGFVGAGVFFLIFFTVGHRPKN
jgi:ABC-type glycerol-3-phosphate transport system substrate-binding protein